MDRCQAFLCCDSMAPRSCNGECQLAGELPQKDDVSLTPRDVNIELLVQSELEMVKCDLEKLVKGQILLQTAVEQIQIDLSAMSRYAMETVQFGAPSQHWIEPNKVVDTDQTQVGDIDLNSNTVLHGTSKATGSHDHEKVETRHGSIAGRLDSYAFAESDLTEKMQIRRRHRLEQYFHVNEEMEEKKNEDLKMTRLQILIAYIQSHGAESALDSAMFIVVIANALVSGVQINARNDFMRSVMIDSIFAFLFWVEFDVPRSMLTVFRCSFGDCSSKNGTPIAEFVSQYYGGGYALGYCIFLFAVTIGIFNVISAIFVDSVMRAASAVFLQRANDRLEDTTLLSTSMATIVRSLWNTKQMTEGRKLSESMAEILELEVTRDELDNIVKFPEVLDALKSLDIDKNDHKKLADILDPDHSGTIGVIELVEGLRRLRGQPRRSDIITIDLMVRAHQETSEQTLSLVNRMSSHVQKLTNVNIGILNTVQKNGPLLLNKSLTSRDASHMRL